MEKTVRDRNIPYLKYALLSYLLLGVTDTVHHLHAAIALSDSAAMHAAKVGFVLVPIAIIAVSLYRRFGRDSLLGVFLSIAVLAIVVPGVYHGGLKHVVKFLVHLKDNSPEKNIGLLFPDQNYNLWFYEISGMFEFVFAIVCSYFVYMLIMSRRKCI